jgi:25S rRNA (adenine2142-N1)-methyltransferase
LKPIVPIVGGHIITEETASLTSTGAPGLKILSTKSSSSQSQSHPKSTPTQTLTKTKKSQRINATSTHRITKLSKKQTQKIISEYHTLNKRLAVLTKQGDHEGAQKVREEMDELGGLDGYQKASLRGGDERKGKGACGKWLVKLLKDHHYRERLMGVDDDDDATLVGGADKDDGDDSDGARDLVKLVDTESGRDQEDPSSPSSVSMSLGSISGGNRDARNRKKATATKKILLLDVGALNGETYAKQSSWIHTTSIDLNPQHPDVQQQDFFERPAPKSREECFHVLCFSLVINFVGEPIKRGNIT